MSYFLPSSSMTFPPLATQSAFDIFTQPLTFAAVLTFAGIGCGGAFRHALAGMDTGAFHRCLRGGLFSFGRNGGGAEQCSGSGSE